MGARRIFAIIPARAGSKAVPGKNIKVLGGYPLIAYSIVAAKLCSQIDRVIVSTDSSQTAGISSRFGGEVPFLRPAELALDTSTDIGFIRHVLDWLESHEGSVPDFLVHLRPTTPLRDPALIDSAIQLIQSSNQATSLRSVHEIPESPRKMFGIQNGFLEGLFPDDQRAEYYNLPRQEFPPTYLPNGYVDVIRTSVVRGASTLHGPHMLAFTTDVVVEVDRTEDFEYLEYVVSCQGHRLHDFLKDKYPIDRGIDQPSE